MLAYTTLGSGNEKGQEIYYENGGNSHDEHGLLSTFKGMSRYVQVCWIEHRDKEITDKKLTAANQLTETVAH